MVSVLLAFVELAYVSLYKERVTSSTAFILMETNAEETKEYLLEYFSVEQLSWLLLFVIPSYFILRGVIKLVEEMTFLEALKAIKCDLKMLLSNVVVQKIKRFRAAVNANYFRKILFGLVVLFLGISIYIKDNHHNYFALFQLHSGYNEYLLEKEKYKANFTGELPAKIKTSLRNETGEDVDETYVLIIGESSTRRHFGIYDYYRPTTPKLNQLKNELAIFNDVISPHSHTIPSLGKVLTFGNRENPNEKYKGSVVQLMKSAGFKTYWISNQVPIGINETMVSMIAQAADYTHYTNLGGKKELRSLDERVLPFFKKVLKDKSTNKKFIIVHLLGTHTNYKNRYPEPYSKFKGQVKTPFPSEGVFETINEYDNAVLYNDYIVSEIITSVKAVADKADEKAFALYFSDHGEDVYETVQFTGHSESIGSIPMFEVPFVCWTNSQSDLKRMQSFSARPYMTDDLIFSLADLAGIDFDGMDFERSIFNDSFKVRDRIIRGNINYNSLAK